jgi:hypothetical protein
MAALADVIDDVRQDFYFSEEQHGQAAMEKFWFMLILASMYYVSEDYEKAEPLLVRYVATAKESPVSNPAEVFCGLSLLVETYMNLNRISEAIALIKEGKSLCKGIEFFANDPLIEALLQRAAAYKSEGNPQSRQWGFVVGLTALSYCMSTGSYRTSAGAQVLDRLRFFFRSYGIDTQEWEWIVKHAHLSRHDFVGLLSSLFSQFACGQAHCGTGREQRKGKSFESPFRAPTRSTGHSARVC